MGHIMVSIIIPCYNEQEFIAQCLDSIINNDFDMDKIEILVMDGNSIDKTRDILFIYNDKYSFIRIINNPGRNKSRALNLGIKESKGQIIMRMDAHCVYERDYITKSLSYLEEYKADNVGGIRKTLPRKNSVMAKSIAFSISNPFAAGTAFYRIGIKGKRWVDTVFGGCWRRDIFEKIGMFNESLTRGQDREFNLRLKQAGGKILLVPDIVCYYFARDKLSEHIKWIFWGGLTPFYISRIVGKILFSWRNLMPLLFVMGTTFSVALCIFSPIYKWCLIAIITFYGICCCYFSMPIIKVEKNLQYLSTMSLIFAITHICYGIGSLYGLIKKIETNKRWTDY
jgi:glycosyltransferase involved in cell wall biosynthesis